MFKLKRECHNLLNLPLDGGIIRLQLEGPSQILVLIFRGKR